MVIKFEGQVQGGVEQLGRIHLGLGIEWKCMPNNIFSLYSCFKSGQTRRIGALQIVRVLWTVDINFRIVTMKKGAHEPALCHPLVGVPSLRSRFVGRMNGFREMFIEILIYDGPRCTTIDILCIPDVKVITKDYIYFFDRIPEPFHPDSALF